MKITAGLAAIIVAFGFGLPLAAIQAQDGLVLHYGFDANEGTIVTDQSGNGHTGTVFGASWEANGVLGGGLRFDGNDDYVVVPDDNQLDLDTNSFTLSAWVKSTSAYRQFVYYKGSTVTSIGSTAYALNLEGPPNIYGSGIVGFSVDDNVHDPFVKSATPLNDGVWHHIVGVRDRTGGDIAIYVDGQWRTNAPDTATGSLANSRNLQIGRFNSGSWSYFNGGMDDLRIYNRALNGAEVDELYLGTGGTTTSTTTTSTSSSTSSTSSTTSSSTTTTSSSTTTAEPAVIPDGLVLHYAFDADEDGIVSDLSGNGNDGIVSGTTWVTNGALGAALSFDGNGDHVVVPDNNQLDLDTSSFTLSAWVKSTSANRQFVFYKGSTVTSIGSTAYALNLDGPPNTYGSGIVSFSVDDNINDPFVKSATPLNDGIWHHIVGVRDRTGGDIAIYVDGQWRTNAPDTASGSIGNTDDLQIGRFNEGSWSFFEGAMDDLRIYNRTLSSGEIYQIFRQGSTLPAIDFDYDGDGASDIAVFHPKTGNWYIRQSADSDMFSSGPIPWGASGKPVPGDYDGDGLADLAVYTPAVGMWNVLQSASDTALGGGPIAWGWSEAVPVPADYDGDGKTDLAVHYAAGGLWYVRQSHDNTMMGGSPIAWGWSATIPVPGDYDGDGRADLAVYYPAEGLWYIRQSTDNKLMGGAPKAWGWSGALPVPGDYDGDHKTDLAVYAPSEGKWYIRSSISGIALSGSPFAWGASAARPVQNDYDGDGKTDIAVYVSKNGKWYIRQSHDGSILGGGSGANAGIAWGHLQVTPANVQYQTLRMLGLVP